MAQLEFSGDGSGAAGQINGAGAVGQGDEVGDDGDSGGIAARAVSGEDDVAAILTTDEDHVFCGARPRERRAQRDEHGADGSRDGSGHQFGFGDLADGAAEVAGVDEVDGVDVSDGAAGDGVDVDAGADSDAGENDEFGASVVAVHVFAGIGFGVAKFLRVSENVGKGCAGFHAAEDVVAGAVEDAFNAGDAVTGEPLLQAGDDGDTAGDGCAIEQVRAFRASEAIEFDAVGGDQLFVAGDDGLAGFE